MLAIVLCLFCLLTAQTMQTTFTASVVPIDFESVGIDTVTLTALNNASALSNGWSFTRGLGVVTCSSQLPGFELYVAASTSSGIYVVAQPPAASNRTYVAFANSGVLACSDSVLYTLDPTGTTLFSIDLSVLPIVALNMSNSNDDLRGTTFANVAALLIWDIWLFVVQNGTASGSSMRLVDLSARKHYWFLFYVGTSSSDGFARGLAAVPQNPAASTVSPNAMTARAGLLYFTEGGTSQKIRKMTLGSPFDVSTLVGRKSTKQVDGLFSASAFTSLSAVSSLSSTELVVADATTLRLIRLANGDVKSFAGLFDLGSNCTADGLLMACISGPIPQMTNWDKSYSLFVDSGIGAIRALLKTPLKSVFDASASYQHFDVRPAVKATSSGAAAFAVTPTKPWTTYVADNVANSIWVVPAYGSSVQLQLPVTCIAAGATYGVDSSGAPKIVFSCKLHSLYIVDVASNNIDYWCGIQNIQGLVDGACGTSRFSSPQGIGAAKAGVYIADTNNNVIRLVSWARFTSTVVGNSTLGRSDGIALRSMLSAPSALCVVETSSQVTVYFAEARSTSFMGSIRQWNSATGLVTTLFSGTSQVSSRFLDGSQGTIIAPTSIVACDSTLLITDSGLVRRVLLNAASPAVYTMKNNLVVTAQFVSTVPLLEACTTVALLDTSAGNISVLRFDTAQTSTTAATSSAWTSPTLLLPGADGLDPSRSFVNGSLVSAVTWCPSVRIAVVAEASQLRFFADLRNAFTVTLGGVDSFGDITCVSGDGSVLVTLPTQHVVVRINGTWDSSSVRSQLEVYGVVGTAGYDHPFLYFPQSIATTGDMGVTVFVGEPLTYRILVIETVSRSRQTYVGQKGVPGLMDGPTADATLNDPGAMVFDDVRGILYFFDTNILRRVITSTQTVDTVLGRFADISGADGVAGVASWTNPNAIARTLDSDRLYVVDTCRLRVVHLDASGPYVASFGSPCDETNDTVGFVGVTVTSDGTVLTVDRNTSTVVAWRDTTTLSTRGVVTTQWGSTCFDYDGATNRDSRRGYTSHLGSLLMIVPSPVYSLLYAIEKSGAVRGLYANGFVTTVRAPSVLLSDPRSAWLNVANTALVIANYGHNNILECPLLNSVDCSVVSGPRSAPFSGGDTLGSGLNTRWVEPIVIVGVSDGFVTFEYSGCRARRLDNTYSSAQYVGPTQAGICTSFDGTLSTARLLFPTAAAVHDDGRIFFAQLSCLRVISTASVTTIVGQCDQTAWGNWDGPQTKFSSLSSIAVVSDFGSDWVYIVDNSTLRRIDVNDPSLVVHSMYGAFGARVFNPDIQSLGPNAVIASLNRSHLFVGTVNCTVAWYDPPEGKSMPSLKAFHYVTPSRTVTTTLDVSNTSTVDGTLTTNLTLTRESAKTLSALVTLSRSLHNVTASVSHTVVPHPLLLVGPSALLQTSLSSVGTNPSLLTLTVTILGAGFDTSNATKLLNIGKYVSFTEVTHDVSTARFVMRLAALAPQMTVFNSSVMQIEFSVDTNYFAYQTETIEVTVSKTLLHPQTSDAIGQFGLTKTRLVSQTQATLQKYALIVGNAAGLVIGVVSLNSGAAAPSARGTLILQLQQCDFLVSDPIPWYNHPTGLAIGSSATASHRGAMLVNPAMLLALLLLHLVATDYVRYYTKKPRRQSMSLSAFPSASMPLAMFFMQPSVTSAMLVAMRDAELLWQVLGGVMAALWAVLGCAVLLFFSRFQSEYVVVQELTGRPPTRTTHFFLGEGKWFDKEGTTAPFSTGMFRFLFVAYRGNREWFLVTEIMASVLAGWGAARIDSGNCLEAAITVTVATALLFAAVLLLRPYATPLDTLFYLCLNLCLLAGSLLMTIPRIAPDASAQDLLSAGGSVANAALIALASKAGLDLVVLFVHFFYARALDKARQIQTDANALPPKAPLLLSPLWDEDEASPIRRSLPGRVAPPPPTWTAPVPVASDHTSDDEEGDGFLERALVTMSEKRQQRAMDREPRKRRRRRGVSPAHRSRDVNPITAYDSKELKRMYDML